MAVLSANSTQALPSKYEKVEDFVCGVADNFFRGAVCCWAAGGGVTPVPAAGLEFAGICVEASNGTTVSGTTTVKLQWGGWIQILYAGTPALTDEGTLLSIDVSAASDNPIDLILHSGGATGDFGIGVITRFVSATAGAWVNLDRNTLATVHA